MRIHHRLIKSMVYICEYVTTNSSVTRDVIVMAASFKDIGEIWSRLFDHRPYLSGEIKFHLREFEESREDREIDRLFKILERVTEINDTEVKNISKSGDSCLLELDCNVEVALNMCNQILDKEESYRLDTTLEARRVLRKEDWRSFIDSVADHCEKVDASFAEKEKELREYYKNLKIG